MTIAMKAASAITSVRYDVFGVDSGGSLLLLLLYYVLLLCMYNFNILYIANTSYANTYQ